MVVDPQEPLTVAANGRNDGRDSSGRARRKRAGRHCKTGPVFADRPPSAFGQISCLSADGLFAVATEEVAKNPTLLLE